MTLAHSPGLRPVLPLNGRCRLVLYTIFVLVVSWGTFALAG